MGPTCEVLVDAIDDESLFAIDAILAAAAQRIERTRKGRVWDLWINGRPIYVTIRELSPVVELCAGLNGEAAYVLLRRLAGAIASALDGLASEPSK